MGQEGLTCPSQTWPIHIWFSCFYPVFGLGDWEFVCTIVETIEPYRGVTGGGGQRGISVHDHGLGLSQCESSGQGDTGD